MKSFHHGQRFRCQLKRALYVLMLSAPAYAQNALDPHVEAIGPASKVPVAIQNLRWHMNDANINALTFRSMDSLFTTRQVGRSGTAYPLPREDHALDFNYRFEGREYPAEAVLDRTYTNALLIMKDGVVVYENYLNNSGPGTHFMGWSMTKSLVSIVVGVAHESGLIESLDNDITTYLPELAGGAYKGVSVRQILEMRSGVDYEENYAFDQPGIAARNHILALIKNVQRFVEPAMTIARLHEPGEVFAYKTIDTAVLGLLVERVSGMHLASYMQAKLWEPMGAESNGFFIMDGGPGEGREFSGAGFNAVLRDFARIGLMMSQDGQINGHQVVSKEWVRTSTAPAGEEAMPLDYGYQWWTVSNTQAYSAIGLQGQYIYVDPASSTVIVKLSYFPPNDPDEAASREAFSFFEAASRWNPK